MALIAGIAACGSPSHPSTSAASNVAGVAAQLHPLDYSRPFSGERVVLRGERIDSNDLEAARRLCATADICYQLSTLLEKRGDKTGARDAMERDCEYRQDARVCETLARRYVDHEWLEPVPGRGDKLLKWACAQHSCSGVEDI
ncbi:MAG: hypothetical protein QM831_19710 [Kofleriaceae bacterium]